jgi:hypothetical protein
VNSYYQQRPFHQKLGVNVFGKGAPSGVPFQTRRALIFYLSLKKKALKNNPGQDVFRIIDCGQSTRSAQIKDRQLDLIRPQIIEPLCTSRRCEQFFLVILTADKRGDLNGSTQHSSRTRLALKTKAKIAH